MARNIKLVETVNQQWEEFDLEGKRTELDTNAAAITEQREASVNSRKKLATVTREYKQLSASEKIQNLGPLLKTYQQEVDSLTNRSKIAENAFLTLYTSLQTLTDPCLALKTAIEEMETPSQISVLELENKKLKGQIEEFQNEFREIKNQEVTIRRLEDKIKDYEIQMNVLVQKQVEEATEQVKKTIDAKAALSKEREESLEHQLEQTKQELAKVLQVYDQAQSQFLAERKSNEDQFSKLQEDLEYFGEEVNKVNAENERLKRERDRLKKELEDINVTKVDHELQDKFNDLSEKFNQKRQESLKLEDQIRSLHQTIQQEQENAKGTINQLQTAVEGLAQQLEETKYTLSIQPSIEKYQKLKQKLKVFKSLEGFEDNIDFSQRSSLEKLLQEKNKKLETSVIAFKDQLTKKDTELEEISQKLQTLVESNEKQKALIQKLEEDISRGYPTTKEFSLTASSDEINAGNTDSMLKIVCNQRDRFQSKVQKLENEKDSFQKQIEGLAAELKSLRSDNVKLYQKIQYLQSYNNKRKEVPDLESGIVESKYKPLYEESVNPFVEFNRKERYSRISQLSPADRITLRMGDFILSNKFSRMFIFGYTIILHLFIFFILYKFAEPSPTTFQ